AVNVAHGLSGLFRNQDRTAVLQAQEVAIDAVVMVALAVYHGQAQAGKRKLRFHPCPGKYVLSRTLVKTIEPVTVRVFVGPRRLFHHRSGIILFFKGPFHAETHQVHLPGAQEYVTLHASGKQVDGGLSCGSGIERGIEDEVEFPVPEGKLELLWLRAVSPPPLDLFRQVVVRLPAIKDRHRVALLQQSLNNPGPEVACSADDERA